MAKGGGFTVLLPPEFCQVDGVSDSMQKNANKMKEALMSIRTNPEEK